MTPNQLAALGARAVGTGPTHDTAVRGATREELTALLDKIDDLECELDAQRSETDDLADTLEDEHADCRPPLDEFRLSLAALFETIGRLLAAAHHRESA